MRDMDILIEEVSLANKLLNDKFWRPVPRVIDF